ncbi:triose-phosphate isomerase [Maritalea sp.]|uniref:triose-phosphate isomerase n=1 Tax=Maritalea sp. TaxID=2003361 RepID=UPI003EF19F35
MKKKIMPLIAGNWKMNGDAGSFLEVEVIKDRLAAQEINADVAICPPATLLHRISVALHESLAKTGAQNCHAQANGAYTGDISVPMISEAGGSYVIVGHSERRGAYNESDSDVRAKAVAALEGGIIPIVCCGESLDIRESGKAIDVVITQIINSCPDFSAEQSIVVAYEPIWAIGTGKTASVADVDEMHNAIRNALTKRFGDPGTTIKILYGGSVKPSNAKELLSVENVNGALVGGASLKADDFLGIIEAA